MERSASGASQGQEQSHGLVSMVDLEGLARAMLPSSSALRDLILSEPDMLPGEVASIKVRMYSRLLRRELGGRNVQGLRRGGGSLELHVLPGGGD